MHSARDREPLERCAARRRGAGFLAGRIERARLVTELRYRRKDRRQPHLGGIPAQLHALPAVVDACARDARKLTQAALYQPGACATADAVEQQGRFALVAG